MTTLKYTVHTGDTYGAYTPDIEYLNAPWAFIIFLIKDRGEVIFTTSLREETVMGRVWHAKYVLNFDKKRHVVVYKPHGMEEEAFFKLMESILV